MKKAVLVASIAIVVLLSAAMLLFRWCSSPAGDGRECLFTVERGWGARRIGEALSDSGLVRCHLYFLWRYSRVEGEGGLLQAGSYHLDGGMTPDSILSLMVRGEVVPVPTHWVTLTPGLTLEQALEILAVDLERPPAELDSLSHEAAFLSSLGIPGMEGYLFPETYEFADSLSTASVLARIVETGLGSWPDAAEVLAAELGLEPGEVVILASIVEREAMVDAERPLIAGVFLTRLRRGKLLESCATVQYALGEVREVLLYSDLDIESPYNTYRNPGLPPTPICSPGKASMEATFLPDTTAGFLYFVSREDGSGTHLFATTYSGHLANRRLVAAGMTD